MMIRLMHAVLLISLLLIEVCLVSNFLEGGSMGSLSAVLAVPFIVAVIQLFISVKRGN